jgi:hypothetical protein
MPTYGTWIVGFKNICPHMGPYTPMGEPMQREVPCEGRKKQAVQKHAERHVVPFSGWDGVGSPMLRWWEPLPAPTRVLLDPTASPLPMYDGSGVGFGL